MQIPYENDENGMNEGKKRGEVGVLWSYLSVIQPGV